jgi:hypothetical protein
MITEDVRRKDIDINQRAFANLINPFIAAFEIMYVLPNGMQGYALFDGEGNLLEKGADDVVSDHTIPEPETTELQAGISCISCHGTKGRGNQGWIDFDNRALLQLFKGDISQVNQAIADTQDRATGLYSNNKLDVAILLGRLRQDYSRAVLRGTNYWGQNPAKPNVLDVVDLSSTQIQQMYWKARYNPRGPAEALKWLGQTPIQGKETAQFQALVPPDQAAATPLSLIPEDPRIAHLRAGDEITVFDFDLAYSFMLDRMLRNQQKEAK